jgi:hypothetical protein
MIKFKEVYWNGLCVLSDFLLLAILIGAASLLIHLSLDAIFEFTPMNNEEDTPSHIQSTVEIVALVLYAPLIAYYASRKWANTST